MRHASSLDFENLEARKLLTKGHLAAVVHTASAVVKVPMVIDGTLAVDNKAAAGSTDAEGDTTTSIPVTGVINGLGVVRGLWNETDDSFGDYLGPDTLSLRDSQGALLITFNAGSLGKLHRTAQRTFYYQLPQRLYAGTGPYANHSESGTIELNTNAARNTVESLTLSTGNP